MAAPRTALFSDPKSDAKKPVTLEALWGQVPTPEPIALRMVQRLFRDRTRKPSQILDPCVGPCTFPKALAGAGVLHNLDELSLIDIDPTMLAESSEWARSRGLKFSGECGDYIEMEPAREYDYAILNPPYVRQEWLSRKEQYSTWFRERYALRVPGTSNLYVYFVIKVLEELRPGGRLACILYDSWQSTRFGAWFADLLEGECDYVAMEPEANQPFHGRLIDATIIYAEKRRARKGTGSRSSSNICLRTGPLSTVQGFSLITNAFQTRRGLRLKQADFFLCDAATAARCKATPFVKKVGKFGGYIVPEDHPEAALLLTAGERKPAIRAELQRRLAEAQKVPRNNVSILTWFRERPESWMVHRPAPHADIVFNYYIRHRPKHILNPHYAYSDNFYGLTAHERISTLAWVAVLNSAATCIEILCRARNQGNGLAKVQLFEYRYVSVPDLQQCSRRDLKKIEELGGELLEQSQPINTLRGVDKLIAAVFADSRLKTPTLYQMFDEVDQKARKPKETTGWLG